MPRAPCVYIMANDRNGTLYTGVTSNLPQRIHQHREGLGEGFTRRYQCKLLVFYETYERMDEAIAREKQIKGGSRAKKMALIEAMNPQWLDMIISDHGVSDSGSTRFDVAIVVSFPVRPNTSNARGVPDCYRFRLFRDNVHSPVTHSPGTLR